MTAALSVLAFVVVATVVGLHVRSVLAVPGVPDDNHCGLVDFRDQAYYPALAVLDGRNPYDASRYMRDYPAVKVFAPYSPVMLVLFMPFALLPLGLAQFFYYLLTLGLIMLLAVLALQLTGWGTSAAAVCAASAFILASRPGEWNALLGQFAVLGAVAACIALYYGQARPWVAGLGLTVSLFKPTYGVPVAILMLAQGDRRAVVIGALIAGSVALAFAGVLAHAAGGLHPLLLSLSSGYAAWRAESGDPLHTMYRVDTAALVARLLGRSPGMAVELGISIGLLGLGAAAVRRVVAAPERPYARAFAASLGSLVVLVAVYHLLYDLLLLALPIAWGLSYARRGATSASTPLSAFTAVLLMLPMINYLASERAASQVPNVWHGATALNVWLPFLVLLTWTAVAMRWGRETG